MNGNISSQLRNFWSIGNRQKSKSSKLNSTYQKNSIFSPNGKNSKVRYSISSI